ncbi:Activator of Hsp90 ATPase homolog 1-like protein [Sinosporangium album]|uniref:Activator of Hsp90 ATPase homolog 1-like protein n=1 Tax=Sinosporangium album TaxID=504805 RepID=A0A1G8DLD7_9ACTN|nr:SRPBCC family protein [Sinosporangium album]SDH58381.1 Activator of Hsp90 ATPase homolog 1-like protein [Sinosporangium album]
MINVTEQINAVARRLGTRVVEAGEARTMTISQTYDAAVEDVWDACTNPERLPRWFLPVTGDLRLGGRYQLEGNAGGEIQRCDPPKSFAATWEFGGGISWIEVRLSPAPSGGTRFELEHTALPDDHWNQYGPGAVGIGWDLGVMGLALHLATGHGNDSAEFAAWSVSPDGIRFATLSGELWCQADIDAGADAEAARAASARTIAFYTTPPQDAPAS